MSTPSLDLNTLLQDVINANAQVQASGLRVAVVQAEHAKAQQALLAAQAAFDAAVASAKGLAPAAANWGDSKPAVPAAAAVAAAPSGAPEPYDPDKDTRRVAMSGILPPTSPALASQLPGAIDDADDAREDQVYEDPNK